MIVPAKECTPEVHKPDTSATLMQQQIWYQDTGRLSLWRNRAGELIDTAAVPNTTGEKDFYGDILGVVQIVFPIDTDSFPRQLRMRSHR